MSSTHTHYWRYSTKTGRLHCVFCPEQTVGTYARRDPLVQQALATPAKIGKARRPTSVDVNMPSTRTPWWLRWLTRG